MSTSDDSLFTSRVISPRQALQNETDFNQEIRRMQTHLKKLIERKNTLYASICRLPPAVLLTTFHFVQRTAIHNLHTYNWIRPRPASRTGFAPGFLAPVLLVCQQWYRIAMGDPSLWGFIGAGCCTANEVRALVERSKDAPLSCTVAEGRMFLPPPTIALSVSAIKPLTLQDIRSLLKQSFRIQHLELAMTVHNWLQIHVDPDFSHLEWRALRSATLIAEIMMYSEPIPSVVRGPYLLPFVAEHLRSLTLQGFCLLPSSTSNGSEMRGYYFPALERLSLNNGWTASRLVTSSLSDILALLSCTPRLQVLELAGSEDHEGARTNVGDPPPTVINLARLRELVLQGPGVPECQALWIAKYLALPSTCSASFSLLSKVKYIPHPEYPRSERSICDNIPHDMMRIILPFPPGTLRFQHLSLAPAPQGSARGVQMNAHNVAEPEGGAATTSLRALHISNNFHTPGYDESVPAERENPNREMEEWEAARSREVQVLLGTCALLSVRTLDWSVLVDSEAWVRILGGCPALRHVRISGLLVAHRLAEALLQSAHDTALIFPPLDCVEVYAPYTPRTIPWGGIVIPPRHAIPIEPSWSLVLARLAAALGAWKERNGRRPLRSLLLGTRVVSCASTEMNMVEDAKTIGALAEVVEELVFL